MQTEERNDESTNSLTSIDSTLYKRNMPRIEDVSHALRQQWEQDEKALAAILDEQKKLRAAHIRFMNLEEEAKQKTERLRRLAVVLSKKGDPFDYIETQKYVYTEGSADEIPLWETVVEVLRQTGELRVVDLNTILDSLLGETSRQAIDSALATHSKEFQIKRRVRETFVSLRK